MFRLKLLGGALIEGPSGLLSGRITQRRRIALLAPLAVARGRPVSRDKLLALLWPDSDSERARHLLSDSVYLIRRELGDAALVTAGNDLRLDSSVVSSDVEDFEQAIERGQLEQAISQYGGPFLDGFHIEDAPEFEHWLDAERERLARSYARSLETLAQECEAGGDSAAAAGWWRRLAAHEPASGRIALNVMRALDAAGDRAGAIQHARTHVLILREQFGIDADPDVIALAAGLRAGSIPRPPQFQRTITSTSQAESEAEPAMRADVRQGGAIETASRDVPRAPAAPSPPMPERHTRPIKWVAILAAAATLAIATQFMHSTPPDVIVVADVARDTVAGDIVSEQLRQVLATSRRLHVMGRPAIAATLQRMGRDPNARLVPELAQEVALREGAKAFVRVDVVTVGNASHLSAALFSADGELLDADAIIAFDETEVLTAANQLVERVSRQFPGTIASVESRDRLPPVTTDSIRALLKHHEGFMVWRMRGDALRAIELAEEAIAIDPDFAQAHLYLSWYLEDHGQSRRALDALLEAYRLRERLSPYERYAVEAFYYSRAEGDFNRAVDRYQAHIVEAKKFGRNQVVTSFLSLANLHVLLRDLDEAERTLQESRQWFAGPFNQAFLVRVLYSQGRDDDAREILETALAAFPEHAWPKTARVHLVAASGDDEQAHALALNVDARHDLPFGLRTAALFDAKHGRLAEADEHLRELEKQMLEENLIGGAIHVTAARAQLRLIANDTLGAVSQVEEFLLGQPIDSVGSLGQPALMVARFFARANRPRRAHEFLAAYERFLPEALKKSEPWLLRQTRAQLAICAGDPAGAIAELQSGTPQIHWNEWSEDPFLPVDSRPELARAWEQAGQPDSAIAVYERYLNARVLFRVALDAFELAGAYQHLAKLYDDRNDHARAAEYRRKLADLWHGADPPLREQLTAGRSLDTFRGSARDGAHREQLAARSIDRP